MISDFDDILTSINLIKIEYYPVILVLITVILFVNGWRYNILLKKLEINLKFLEALKIYLIGMSMSITPIGAGSMIKSYILKNKTGKSISFTAPVIIFEKWIEMTSIVIVVGLLLFKTEILASQIVFILGLALILFLLFVFRKTYGLKTLNQILQKIPFLKSLVINTDEFKNAIKLLFTTKLIIQLFSVSIFTKILVMGIIFLIFQSFDVQTDFFVSSQIFLTSSLVGLFSFLPGGLVASEMSLLGLMLDNGIDISKSSILVIFIKLITFWLPMIAGFFALKSILKQRTF